MLVLFSQIAPPGTRGLATSPPSLAGTHAARLGICCLGARRRQSSRQLKNGLAAVCSSSVKRSGKP